jgi:hypothetical protein
MNGHHDIAVGPRDFRIIVSNELQADLLCKHGSSAASISVEAILVHSDDLEMLRTTKQILQLVDKHAKRSCR